MSCLVTNVSLGPISLAKPAGINKIAIRPSVRVSSASKVDAPPLSSSASHVGRRSGNYPPAEWDVAFIQTLKNDFTPYVGRRNMLKERVRTMLDNVQVDAISQLELIHDLQRLGISYHFKDKIKSILSAIHLKTDTFMTTKDLYATALTFTLLRQHGFHVSQDVFDTFKDEKGKFMEKLCKDTKGMLQLYEASYLLTENESSLESAREFAAKNLKMEIISDKELDLLVQHTLELPLHWRSPRVEARWYIDLWEKGLSNKNTTLFELAKLDFNIVQGIHQTDLKDSARWWENTCLCTKLAFIRNSLVVCFFWTVGKNFEPGFEYFRRMETKVDCFLTTIDDIYDVYGTLDELELFTQAVERWDMNEMDNLPDYMKICYLALFNSINEMAYDTLKQKGFNPITYLRKAWADLCNSYLKEAKWYYSGYTPTLEEYLENGWISITVPVILVHAYILAGCEPITEEALQSFLHPYHSIIRHSSMIVRLADDLGTSSEELQRGDVPKAMQCYMNDTGASEEEAREYVRFLIGESWKKLNEERVNNSGLSPVFVEIAVNLARFSQCLYEYGDGHGHSNIQTKDRLRALFFNPIDPTV